MKRRGAEDERVRGEIPLVALAVGDMSPLLLPLVFSFFLSSFCFLSYFKGQLATSSK